MKKVLLISLGGTISMCSNSSKGLLPKLGSSTFAKLLCKSLKDVKIYAKQLEILPSPSLDISLMLKTLRFALSMAKKVDAIIITQGTDTLEETSFLASLLWQEKTPLIFSASMRGADALGYDGLANMQEAILTSFSKEAKKHGVLCVINSKIFLPKDLVKLDSVNLNAFGKKEIGIIKEQEAIFFYKASKKASLNLANKILKKKSLNAEAVILTQSLTNNLQAYISLLEFCFKNFEIIIIEGFGSAHVHKDIYLAIKRLLKIKKVVLIACSPCLSGGSTYKSYGYEGSEIALQKLGVYMGGFLDAKKARLLGLILFELGRIEEFKKLARAFF